ncbi:MAG: cysteine hydrolase [Candidatus Methanomethylophilaceae archaeon]|nr:cysteine hydrolase [Candidatus Methanomethylophilaceae archaeon]
MGSDGHMQDPLNGFSDRKVALIIIDVQNKFVDPEGPVMGSLMKRMGRINEAADAFRRTGNPVVVVLFDGDSHNPGGENPDGLVDGLRTSETDEFVHKSYMNSFRETDLEEVVKKHGCTGVVLAGLVAQYCVISTYYAAFDHGLVPYMLKGGIASNIEEKADSVERICKCVGMEDILGNVNFSGKA